MKRKNAEPTDKYFSGPLRWEQLPPDIEARVRAVFYSCGRYVIPNFEQWEVGFCREKSPESELLIWEGIDAAFRHYFAEREMTDESAAEVVYHLLALSLGMEKEDPLYHELKRLYVAH